MTKAGAFQPGHELGAGRYILEKRLGQGGMGVVWLAKDTRLGEEIALKFLPPEVAADDVALNDLRRETARSHKLTHSNIVRIHDFHEQPDGSAFISMEYVDGPTLSAWRLKQPGEVLSWPQLASLAQQLCAALDYAHGEGVIHRDLKPANVMLDAKGRVKLADFGIAACVTDSMSRVSGRPGTSGTWPYMSPQQLTGKTPQVTDDIYSLGATFYELLTARPPFYTGDITHQILNEGPQPLGERLVALGVHNDIPEELAALIVDCLAKDAAQRPQRAAAVALRMRWRGVAQVGVEEIESSCKQEGRPSTFDPARSGKNLALGLGVLAVVLLLAIVGGLTLHKDSRKGNPLQQGSDSINQPTVGQIAEDLLPVESFWVGKTVVPGESKNGSEATFYVTDRSNNTFRAQLQISRPKGQVIVRNIAGTIVGNKISWLSKDVIAVSAGPGPDQSGLITGTSMKLSGIVVMSAGPKQGQEAIRELTLERQSGKNKFSTPEDMLPLESVWEGRVVNRIDGGEPHTTAVTFNVLDRSQNKFRARLETHGRGDAYNIREFTGRLIGNKIGWRAQDVKVIVGDSGFDYDGIINGKKMELSGTGVVQRGGAKDHRMTGDLILERK